MTAKRRHQTIDLGTISANAASAEIDMSSFTHALLFVEWPSAGTGGSAIDTNIEVSPTPFTADADWYTVYNSTGVTANLPVIPYKVVMEGNSALGVVDLTNRSLPLGTTRNAIDQYVPSGTCWTETPLPRRLRVRPDTTVAAKVQVSREIG
tara:strand:+ start:48 stop:500 length:453 start_codon:yes stop_codon:yes gene_type:complete